jgi:hypothetical protein
MLREKEKNSISLYFFYLCALCDLCGECFFPGTAADRPARPFGLYWDNQSPVLGHEFRED